MFKNIDDSICDDHFYQCVDPPYLCKSNINSLVFLWIHLEWYRKINIETECCNSIHNVLNQLYSDSQNQEYQLPNYNYK